MVETTETLPLNARMVGSRYPRFDNGQHETIYAVEVDHEPTGERWEQIWVLRSEAMAQRVTDALNAADADSDIGDRGLVLLVEVDPKYGATQSPECGAVEPGSITVDTAHICTEPKGHAGEHGW